MKGLLQRWQAHREAKVLARRAIPDPLWQLTLARLPFLAQRSDADLAELRRLASLFLDQKEFTGADGLVVDDAMAVCIAVQAVLPVLRVGLAPYDGFVGIVVHPDEVVARREVMDDDGVVHAYDEVLAGEAMEGGPVMLSWRDVADAGETAASGYNVVIHEFAHVLDMGDGAADGVPPLPSAQARRDWLAVLMPAYDRHGEQVVCGYDTLLDPYGAQGPEEFFAVASETFFVNPKELRAEHPDLYGLLARYFRQDPAAFTP
ncbi:MAG: zinc-dependent peptidase [Burkholderiaceae bacterium]|jgi:MtfA peptidase|nr:zinc-dependent peptidase [Burkholderiaceae bacterium]